MRKKIEWKWEILDWFKDDEGNSTTTARCKVIGGWIVHHAFTKKNAVSESMQFVSDKDHEWHILEAPKPEEERATEPFL
jgi:hypothetical protein